LDPYEVYEILQETAIGMMYTVGFDFNSGYGLVDAAQAVESTFEKKGKKGGDIGTANKNDKKGGKKDPNADICNVYTTDDDDEDENIASQNMRYLQQEHRTSHKGMPRRGYIGLRTHSDREPRKAEYLTKLVPVTDHFQTQLVLVVMKMMSKNVGDW
jgi:hypothetical protein